MSESIREPLPPSKATAPPPTPPEHATHGISDPRQALDAIAARHAPVPTDVEHVRAALGYVERSAREGLAQLEALHDDQSPRDALVVKITLEVGHAVDDLGTKIRTLSAAERGSLRRAADAAAVAVLDLRAWVRSRAPNARMVGHLESTIRELDPVLQQMGVAPVGQRVTPALKDDETAESQVEQRRVTQASLNLLAAIDLERDATVAGISAFCRDQMIEDEEDAPSFVEAVAKSLVIAAVGHLIGEQVGKLVGKMATATKRAVSDKVMERVVDVSTDFVQGFSGELVAARKESEKVKQDKARAYFAMALEIGAHRAAFEQKNVVNAAVASGSADPAILDMEASAKTKDPGGVAMSYARTAAQLWSSYQAQSSLGTHALVTQGRKISNMTDYFGEHNASGRVFGTGRQGTHGVARLDVSVSAAGDLSMGTFEIAGSNSVVAELVAAHAGGQLDRIWLPKEVTVVMKQYRAVIAVDETNRVRDSIGWEDFARAFPEHSVLGSPYRFWSHVRGTRV